jgi:hypothetical protein
LNQNPHVKGWGFEIQKQTPNQNKYHKALKEALEMRVTNPNKNSEKPSTKPQSNVVK